MIWQRFRTPNRRTVLKTLGAGVVGGTTLSGSAAASCGADLCISMSFASFNPETASVKLGSDDEAVVQWAYNEPRFPDGKKHPHDVNLPEEVPNADGDKPGELNSRDLLHGDTYRVRFYVDGSSLMAEEIGNEEDGESVKLTDSFSGSHTFDYQCDHHTSTDGSHTMTGSLTVKK